LNKIIEDLVEKGGKKTNLARCGGKVEIRIITNIEKIKDKNMDVKSKI